MMKTKGQSMNKSFSLKELARRALAILLTISMVASNTPLAYAADVVAQDATQDSTEEAASTTEQSDSMEATSITEEETTEGVVEESSSSNTVVEESADGKDSDEAESENTHQEAEVVDQKELAKQDEVEVALNFEHAYIHYKGQTIGSPTTSVAVPGGEDFQFAATADEGCILSEVKVSGAGDDVVLEANAEGMYVVPGSMVVEGVAVSVIATTDPFATDDETQDITEKRNEQSEFVYEDDSVKVTATLTDPSALPADVTFKVTPITRESKDAQGNKLYDYDAYLEALNNNAEDGFAYTDQNTLMYDVAFLTAKKDEAGNAVKDEWTEVQLTDGQVKLDFQFKKNQLGNKTQSDMSNVEIHHLPLVDSVRSSVETTADATSIDPNDVVVERPDAQAVDVKAETAEVSVNSLSPITFTDLTSDEQSSVDAGKYPITVTAVDENGTEVALSTVSNGLSVGATYECSNNQWYSWEETKTASISGASGTTVGVDVPNSVNHDVVQVKISDDNGSHYYVVGQQMGEYRVEGTMAENGARITLRKVSTSAAVEPYTVTTNFYDYDKTTKLTKLTGDAALGTDIAVLAKLTAKGSGSQAEPIAWAIQTMPKATLNEAGGMTVTFSDGFDLCDASYNATGRKIGYDSTQYDLDISLYTNKNGQRINTYADAVNSDRSVPNYDFFYNDEDAEGGSDRLIKLHRGFTKYLTINIKNNSKSNITQNDKVFAVVKMKHASTGESYYAAPVTVEAGKEAVIGPITTWYDNNGSAKNDEEYTGNQELTIYLAKGTNAGSFQYTQINNSQQYRILEQGDLVGAATLSIGKLDKTTDSVNHVNYTTQYFTVSENYNVFDDGLDFQEILGNAKYFGVVANVWEQTESETNAAVKQIYAEAQTGNDLISADTNDADDMAQPWYVGEVASGELHVKGEAIDMYTPKSEQSKIISVGKDENDTTMPGLTFHTVSKEAIDQYIDSMLDYTRAQSAAMASKNSLVGAYPVTNSANQFVLDFTGYGAGTIYLPLDEEIQKEDGSKVKLLDLIANTANVALQIKKKSNQVVVLNSNEKNITMQDFSITMTNVDTNVTKEYGSSAGLAAGKGDAFSADIVTTLVWNFPQAESVNIATRVGGIILAPEATVTESDGACGGWIVCDTFKNPGGKEWHNTWQHYDQEYEKIVDISGVKQLEGNDLAANQFEFALEKVEGDQQSVVETKRNDANGKITFVIKVTEEGTYHYKFHEVLPEGVNSENPTKDGITYDTTVHDVTVVVTKAGHANNRYLNATVTYDNKEELPTFKNKQTDEETTDIHAQKVWNDGGTTGVVTHPAITLHLVKHVGQDEEVVEGQDRVIPANATGDALAVAWSNLPVKDDNGNALTYSVTEDPVPGYTTTFTGSAAEGYTITNTKEATGGLTVTKVVSSANEDDLNKTFAFTVTLSKSLSGTYGNMTFENGSATVEIQGNGSKTATGLPLGTTYTVVETDDSRSGYQVEGEVTADNQGTITENTAEVTITNTPEARVGSLSITKTVSTSFPDDVTKAFNFTIELKDQNDQPVSGTYSGVTFDQDGKATIALKGGDSKVIEGLPEGTKYKVTETDNENYTVSYEGQEGTIEKDVTKTVAVTNARVLGELSVSKSVVSAIPADRTQSYHFKVTLNDTSITGAYGQMTFNEGVAEFDLADGQSVSTGRTLPMGIGYAVEETESHGLAVGSTNAEGTIPGDSVAESVFTNTHATGNLTINKKLVSDAAADAARAYSFEVTLSDNTINGVFGAATFANGVATVSVVGAGSATIEGLPTGVTYTVTEKNTTGFSVTGEVTDQVEAKDRTISAGTATVTITNTRVKGDLEVTKTVASSNNADKTKDFTFHVRLGDTSINGEYGGMSFENGVATFTLRDGGKATATGLPTGIAYEVEEEAAAGFITTKTGETGSISTAKATAAFTNAKTEGGLVVSKSVTSTLPSDSTRKFTFTVTLDDESIEGKYGDMTFAGGEATVELAHGESATATGLPEGVQYTVVETDNEDYEVDYAGQTTAAIQKDATGEVEVTNTRKTGNLEVTKTVASDAAADQSMTFNFEVQLGEKVHGKFGDMEFDENGKATFTLQGGQTKQATGLPTGVSYEVREGTAEGFVKTEEGVTGSVEANKTSTAAFTNTREKGGLTVKKVVESDAQSDKQKEFEFVVTLSDATISKKYGDMQFTNGVASFKLKDGQTMSATDMPTGITYTVEERNGAGFEVVKTGDTGTIRKDAVATATFTNKRLKGGFSVKKVVTSSTASDETKDFNFTVTLSDTTISGTYGQMEFTNGVANFTLKHDETKTAENLPREITYTVVEETADGFVTTHTGNADGQAVTDTPAQVVFTNTKSEGGLVVSKSVTSLLEADKTKEFDFTVTLGDKTISGTYGEMTFTEGKASFKLADGQSKSATGLPEGVTYAVEEGTYDDFTTKHEGEASGTIAKGDPKTVAFANTRKQGGLEVTKTVTSDAAADKSVPFNFKVTLEPALSGTFRDMSFDENGIATFTLKHGESLSATGLPVGVKYTVEEEKADGFTVKQEGETGTISTTKSTAAFTNTRERGGLKVQKLVDSDKASDNSATYEVKVTLGDTTITGDYGDMKFENGVATVRLTKDQTVEARDLPTGVSYTVEEQLAEGQDDYIVTYEGRTGTVAKDAPLAQVTNTRTTGSLTVSKTLFSEAQADDGRAFEFTIVLDDASVNGTYGNIAFNNGTAVVTIAGGTSLTATGLPTDVSYTITETASGDFVQGNTTAEGTISGTASQANFTNTRKTGGFDVHKKVVSSTKGDEDKDFAFTITLGDKTIEGEHGDVTFTAGVANLSLKHDQTAQVRNLPIGVTYEVAEQTAGGFVTTSVGETGTVIVPAEGGSVPVAEFTNTKSEGGLVVSKSVRSDVGADHTKEFSFKVTLGNTTINGTYGEMTFKDGVAEFALTDTQSKKAEGLPEGTTYTVEETADGNFTTTYTGKANGAEDVESNTGTVEKDKTKAVEVTNTRKTGNLTIAKELVSKRAADADLTFGFTVTLLDAENKADESINTSYSGVAFEKGVGTVTVKGNESKRLEGLPANVNYTVVENETGVANIVQTGRTGDEGTITDGEDLTAEFTNTRNTGSLEVKKTVRTETESDKRIAFNFQVELADKTISGKFGDMTFSEGVATLTLTDGQSAKAQGLPTDVSYTVTETDANTNGFVSEWTGQTGTVTKDATPTAEFTNTRLYGSLELQKLVQVDGDVTTGTAADGTYRFRITGPGLPEGGRIVPVTVEDGRSGIVTVNKLFVGTYTVEEVTEGLPANMRLIGENSRTVEVTGENTESVPVVAFINNLNTAKTHMEATKVFNNWDKAEVKEFGFKLAPVDGAPMPEGDIYKNGQVKTATAKGKAVFDDITYTSEGIFKYTIQEVVPEGASDEGVYKGIQYDTKQHTATVTVSANDEGTLTPVVTYDNGQSDLKVTNTYDAKGSIELQGEKKLTGRPFQEGDEWTFTITQPEGQNAPMPKTTEVTVKASEDAKIKFGAIEFGLDDVRSEPYTYTITETGQVTDVVNDAQASKTVQVTVADKGDGTLSVTTSGEGNAFEFTNAYEVKQPLEVQKGIEGREWKKSEDGKIAEDYTFELKSIGATADEMDQNEAKRQASNVATTAVTHGNEHKANFGTFKFTEADLNKTFTYNVKEAVPEGATWDDTLKAYVLEGVAYTSVAYDVTYTVVKDDAGKLQVQTTYKHGETRENDIKFLNKYSAKSTSAVIEAKKVLKNREIADGEFTFELYFVTSEGKQTLQDTKTSGRTAQGDAYDEATKTDTQTVTFDAVDCIKAGTERYIVKEVRPEGAVKKTNDDGKEVWVKDGVTYDDTEHEVRIVTTDNLDGTLSAKVVYEDETAPVFTNTYFGAVATLSFDKEYYGNDGKAAFGFTMTGATESYDAREGAPITYTADFVDTGKALKATAKTTSFQNNKTAVSMPKITYHEPGTYYYTIAEDANENVDTDDAVIRAKVVVSKDAKAEVSYVLVAGNETFDYAAGERPTLYNNSDIQFSFASNALRMASTSTAFTNFEPAVKKVMKNGALKGGEFEFELYEGEKAEGTPLTVAANDADGKVSFGDIEYGVNDIGKTYTYTIKEKDGGDEAVIYDAKPIKLTVVVTEGTDGGVITTGTYEEATDEGIYQKTDDPTFVNAYDEVVIRTVKRSREEPHDPLPGAHYGLWMVNPSGEDVYMGLGRNQVEEEGSILESNDEGELYYDFPVVEGVAYYFLEEFPPPAGHLVDPYPTDYFTLVHDEETGTYRIVYETEEEFATICPDVVLRD